MLAATLNKTLNNHTQYKTKYMGLTNKNLNLKHFKAIPEKK